LQPWCQARVGRGTGQEKRIELEGKRCFAQSQSQSKIKFMRSKSEIISLLTNPGVIAVVRARKTEQVLPLSEALLAGGVIAIEITMTTPNAVAAIREASAKLGERALIGVGTILKPYDCQQALDAGAQFIVSPICRTELVALAHGANKPIMLGAYTPTEAQLAYEAGSDFVKIFPADGLGPNYIKALRAPLPHLRIVPTGGVDLKTIGEFFKAGCVAVGVGSSLVSTKLLQEKNWTELTRLAGEFVKAAQQARAK
jgi:2-dehydro-3-deoxyphosphogluconate aldolase/(4S)-4-hydroxy-2-oxoglutarate aldolase